MAKAKFEAAQDAAQETTVINPETAAPEQQPETLPAVSTNQAIAAAESFGNVSFEFENEDHIDDNAELQQKDIITLLDKEKNSFISASTVLVSACKRIKHIPCLIRIVHKGEVKMTGGRKYDNFAMLTSPVNL